MENSKAFTLVELIIVVIIIGILTTIAVPMYANAQAKSKAKVLFADMELLMKAEKIYKMEKGAWFTCVEPATPSCNTELHLEIRGIASKRTFSFNGSDPASGVLTAFMTFPSGDCTYTYTCSATTCTSTKPILSVGAASCPLPGY